MFTALKMKFLNWWYTRQMEKNPEKVILMLNDLLHPPQIDWNLSSNEKIILDRYVSKFVDSRDIAYEDMDISQEHYPNLYRLTCALQGTTKQRESWAAYDWMLKEYKDLEKLTEELGELDDWG